MDGTERPPWPVQTQLVSLLLIKLMMLLGRGGSTSFSSFIYVSAVCCSLLCVVDHKKPPHRGAPCPSAVGHPGPGPERRCLIPIIQSAVHKHRVVTGAARTLLTGTSGSRYPEWRHREAGFCTLCNFCSNRTMRKMCAAKRASERAGSGGGGHPPAPPCIFLFATCETQFAFISPHSSRF